MTIFLDAISDICIERVESISTGDTVRQKRKYSRHQPKRMPLKRIEVPPSDDTPSKKNRGRRFTCELCQKICWKKKALYRHYSVVHFKEKLRGLLSKESGAQCPRCHWTWEGQTERSKINHIGVDHKVVERFLHNSRKRKKKEVSSADSLLDPEKENQEEKNRSKRRSRKDSFKSSQEASLVRSGFNCHLCRRKKMCRSRLYNHYSIAHYKEELMSLIDKESLQCPFPFCGWKRNNIDMLILHLGAAHDKVEDFLPLQFHLPRSKARKYSKTSSTSHPDSHIELTRDEQTVEQSTDPVTTVNCERGEGQQHDSQDSLQSDQPTESHRLTDTTQHTNKNNETESNEKTVQTLSDEEKERALLANIRSIFDGSDSD